MIKDYIQRDADPPSTQIIIQSQISRSISILSIWAFEMHLFK